MTAWRMPLTIVLVLSAVPAAFAQTHELSEAVKAGDCFHYKLEMQLGGEMRFVKEDAKPVTVKLTAAAQHNFPERILVADAGLVTKVVRVYESARSQIQRGEDRNQSVLRAERKLIVAQRHKNTPLSYSPSGALTRSESELVSDHFDTLSLTGLLPGKAVKVGDTWPITSAVAQALMGMEGMTKHELLGKLEKADDKEATIRITGTATGVWQGASIKTTVEAIATYDAVAKRLTKVVWRQKDDRDQGPVNPASSMEVTVTVTRTFASERPASLNDVAIVSVPDTFTPPPQMTNLEYREAKGRYSLVHPRDWILTAETGDHAIFRLMDGGLWVAQVTVTPWRKAKKGEHWSAEQFTTAMKNTGGWRPERELQAGEIKTDNGNWTYRLSEIGLLNGVNVLQNFYLVANPEGEQVVLVFTLAPKMAEKLGARDLTFAASIEVPAKK